MEIRKLGDPVLRKRGERIDKIDGSLKALILSMEETMKKNYGVGLAASQIGISKQLAIVCQNPNGTHCMALINPEVIKKSSEKTIAEEGCLSFPGIFLDLRRAKEITVKALDKEGRELNFKAKDFFARVIQHEVDHIGGILFFDRLPLFQKFLFMIKHPGMKVKLWI